MIAIIISFIIITIVNFSAYLWAYKRQSDHLTDISYSLCFIAVTSYFLFFFQDISLARCLLAFMVIVWGVRLGGFLFYRIHQMGKDDRFDNFRGDAYGFLKFWLLQSISISIIILPVLYGLMATELVINVYALGLWTLGWTMQTVADWQKFTFRSKNPPHQYIDYGLYKYVRHPNYLGEIMIWVSIFWYVIPILSGWLWLSIISPLWIIILLVRISGIPLIEEASAKKYQNNAQYTNYVKRTWRLLPFLY